MKNNIEVTGLWFAIGILVACYIAGQLISNGGIYAI